MDQNEILIALSESEQTAFGRVDFCDQSDAQKVFSANWELEGQVHNGGFSQYFQNWSNETAYYVVEALTRVNAIRTAELCQQAISIAFPAGLPDTHEAIEEAANQFSEEIEDRLGALDSEFYKHPDDLTNLLYLFVWKNPLEFGPVPQPD